MSGAGGDVVVGGEFDDGGQLGAGRQRAAGDLAAEFGSSLCPCDRRFRVAVGMRNERSFPFSSPRRGERFFRLTKHAGQKVGPRQDSNLRHPL